MFIVFVAVRALHLGFVVIGLKPITEVIILEILCALACSVCLLAAI